MGFRQGAYARVWKIEDKGNYAVGQVSISRKDKETNKYVPDFQDGYVRFVGNAYESIKDVVIPENGISIKIASCDCTSRYNKEKQKTYINFVIFGLEIPDGSPASNEKPKAEIPSVEIDDDELPF